MHTTSGTEKLAYSLSEACAATSLGKSTLYALIAAGRVTAIKVGGRTLIPADDLRALIAADADQDCSDRKSVQGGAKK